MRCNIALESEDGMVELLWRPTTYNTIRYGYECVVSSIIQYKTGDETERQTDRLRRIAPVFRDYPGVSLPSMSIGREHATMARKVRYYFRIVHNHDHDHDHDQMVSYSAHKCR